MTYAQRLDRYRQRLIREIDSEIAKLRQWLADEPHDDLRDGFRARIDTLEAERTLLTLDERTDMMMNSCD